MYAHPTGVAVALIVTLYVPFVVFAVISGEPSAAGWAMLSGVAVLKNLMIGGRGSLSSRRVADGADPGRNRVRGSPGGGRGADGDHVLRGGDERRPGDCTGV